MKNYVFASFFNFWWKPSTLNTKLIEIKNTQKSKHGFYSLGSERTCEKTCSNRVFTFKVKKLMRICAFTTSLTTVLCFVQVVDITSLSQKSRTTCFSSSSRWTTCTGKVGSLIPSYFAGPQPKGCGNREVATPPKISKTCLVVRYNNKLQSFCPPIKNISWLRPRAVASGGASGARPPIWNLCPHFTFGPLVAAYIQYSIFKMWPPFWFLAPPSDFSPPTAKSWRRACCGPYTRSHLRWSGVSEKLSTC